MVESRREDVVENLHGRDIADPYRWLEDDPDDWVRRQNNATEDYLASLPARDWFRRTMAAILGRPRTGVPVHKAGWYLVERNDGSQLQDVLCIADSLAGLLDGGRVVVDPNSQSLDGSVSIGSFSVSSDGRYLVYGTMTSGSPWLTFFLVDLSTGAELDDQITDTKLVAPTWLPDSSSYLYLHFPGAGDHAGANTAGAISGALKLHRVGTSQSEDRLVLSFPAGSQSFVEVKLSHDGRYLVAQINEGTDQRTRLWVYPVQTQDGSSTLGEPMRLIDEPVANTRFVRTIEDRLVLWTDQDAPHGRIVTCSLEDPTFEELIPEGQNPLIAVSPAGGGLVTVSLIDAQPVIELHSLAGKRSRIPLTGGAVVGLNGEAGDDEIFIGLSSTTTPTEVSVIDAATCEVRALPGDAGEFLAPEVTVVRRKAPGREVPYFLISRADLDYSEPRPTMLYGYGGFKQSQLADYRPGRPAWLAAGGVLVIANLRGGGEFGSAWHEAGRLKQKQNTFDDCIAVAEHLHETKVTTPSQLALHGHSGGGLLVGAVMTQRPDLLAAALPSAGVLDMLRFHLFTIGRAWAPEIGLPEDADQFEDLLAYSPLHNLREGTKYPATLVLTSDHDDIVVPLHSYKFTATLQHAQAADEPVLIRVDVKTGHGPGRAATTTASEWADLLAFAAHHTGLTPMRTLDPGQS